MVRAHWNIGYDCMSILSSIEYCLLSIPSLSFPSVVLPSGPVPSTPIPSTMPSSPTLSSISHSIASPRYLWYSRLDCSTYSLDRPISIDIGCLCSVSTGIAWHWPTLRIYSVPLPSPCCPSVVPMILWSSYHLGMCWLSSPIPSCPSSLSRHSPSHSIQIVYSSVFCPPVGPPWLSIDTVSTLIVWWECSWIPRNSPYSPLLS